MQKDQATTLEQQLIEDESLRRQKQLATVQADDRAFWEATARHWQKEATRHQNAAMMADHSLTSVKVENYRLQGELIQARASGDQHKADCIAAEARSDAYGDILESLAAGWRISGFVGCAKWWRQSTDDLTSLAAEAREWYDNHDLQPVDENGQRAQESFNRSDMIAFIQSAYSQGMPQPFIGVHNLTDDELLREFQLAHRFVAATNERREREAAQQAERTATDEPEEINRDHLLAILQAVQHGYELPGGFDWSKATALQVETIARVVATWYEKRHPLK